MPTSEKDRLAAEAMDRWEDFQEGLSSDKRRYPIQQFRAFWSAATRYAELTKSDSLIHKSLAAAVNGLVDFLGAERKRVPSDILRDAERLECFLFSGYDPYFRFARRTPRIVMRANSGWVVKRPCNTREFGRTPSIHFSEKPTTHPEWCGTSPSCSLSGEQANDRGNIDRAPRD